MISKNIIKIDSRIMNIASRNFIIKMRNLLREINAMNKIDQIYEEICQIINLK